MMPTYLFEFYKNGFNTTEQCAALKDAYPDKVILAGRIDPRDGEQGLEQLEEDHARWGSAASRSTPPSGRATRRAIRSRTTVSAVYLEKCRSLGIDIIHVHKGPTIHPLNSDAFDVRDVDDVATAFPDLKFVVDHCGIPRIDDFCWIAIQEPNVYGGLSVVSGLRPHAPALLRLDDGRPPLLPRPRPAALRLRLRHPLRRNG